VLRINADLLIPGRGAPLLNGVVLVEEGRITHVSEAKYAPDTPDAVVTRVPVLMPGMWETHAHFYGTVGGFGEQRWDESSEVLIVRAAQDVTAGLNAGFTSAREAGGGLGLALAQLVDEGTLPGPKIYPSGPFLSCTGGHGDYHQLPAHWVDEICTRGGNFRLCDGTAECLIAVRELLRSGVRAIKVCTSGGVASLRDDPMHQQFSDEELSVIVEEAARRDVAVMAHAHGPRGVKAALRAGCRTIEHGSHLDDEAIELMLEHDAILVPTRLIIERMIERLNELPSYQAAKIIELAAAHQESLERACEAGVRIALGTDVAHRAHSQSLMPWGINGGELPYLVAAGMSSLGAIEAATANGPSTLGPQAPRAGQILVGYDADLIAVVRDPIAEIAVLADADSITHVWRGGHLVKQPQQT
jgi:imidazolonepropionase-like amidohydrolase